MQIIELFKGATILAGGNLASQPIDLSHVSIGAFSLYYEMNGAGTGTLSYQVSWDGAKFISPTGTPAIATGVTNVSGPVSNGIDAIGGLSISPMLAPWIKFIWTETGGVSPINPVTKLTMT